MKLIGITLILLGAAEVLLTAPLVDPQTLGGIGLPGMGAAGAFIGFLFATRGTAYQREAYQRPAVRQDETYCPCSGAAFSEEARQREADNHPGRHGHSHTGRNETVRVEWSREAQRELTIDPQEVNDWLNRGKR